MLLKSLLPGRGTKKLERWALRDINLSIEAGETVGIIGHNGAGKTTLLRLLAGVSRPSEGRLRIAGRVAPLLSVGVGFHQEMSGRENVLVNGMLLGLTRKQVESRFDEIVTFAELEDFIDTPVKFYSSGMYMRLGFAVAVHVEPEVMLVDEILAVGDVAFQLKCFERMRKLQAGGTTIVFVSHSVHAIRLLCPRAILIRAGHLEFDGSAEDAIARHFEILSIGQDVETGSDTSRLGGPVTVLARSVLGTEGATHHPGVGETLKLQVSLRFNTTVASPTFTFRVTSADGIPCYAMHSFVGKDWRTFGPGDVLDVEVEFAARLGGGTYRLGLTMSNRDANQVLFDDPFGPTIFVAPRLGAEGFTDLEASIAANGTDLTQHDSLLMVPSETHTEFEARA